MIRCNRADFKVLIDRDLELITVRHAQPAVLENLRKGKILLMEGYNHALARRLVTGVDVWINTPIYPLEASGTSGQKAGINGVLNLSVRDGWWDEGYEGDNGWAIGGRDPNPDEGAQDWADAQDLYRLLEEEAFRFRPAPRRRRRRREGHVGRPPDRPGPRCRRCRARRDRRR